MSDADERRREQAAIDAEPEGYETRRMADARQRVPAFDGDPRSWRSRCAGTRDGRHYRLRVEANGQWRCRYCLRACDPPARYVGVAWTRCEGAIDLAKPIGVQRSRGRAPVFVYECPACQSITRRLGSGTYRGKDPLPASGTVVCGAQVPQRGAA